MTKCFAGNLTFPFETKACAVQLIIFASPTNRCRSTAYKPIGRVPEHTPAAVMSSRPGAPRFRCLELPSSSSQHDSGRVGHHVVSSF